MRKMNVKSLLCWAFVIFIVFLLVRYFGSFREGATSVQTYNSCHDIHDSTTCRNTPLPGANTDGDKCIWHEGATTPCDYL